MTLAFIPAARRFYEFLISDTGILLLLFVTIGPLFTLGAFLSMAIHELGHALFISFYGHELSFFSLSAVGIKRPNLTRQQAIVITLAGLFMNILFTGLLSPLYGVSTGIFKGETFDLLLSKISPVGLYLGFWITGSSSDLGKIITILSGGEL